MNHLTVHIVLEVEVLLEGPVDEFCEQDLASAVRVNLESPRL